MKKTHIILAVAFTLSFTGCALMDKIMPSAGDPQEVIQDMISKMQDISSASFNISSSIKGDHDAEDLHFDVIFDVDGESEKINNATQFALEFDFEISAQDPENGNMEGTAQIELCYVNDALYFSLNDVNLPEKYQQMTDSFISMYVGNWYKLPSTLLPPDISQHLQENPENAIIKEQIKVLINKTQFFNILESSTEGDNLVYSAKLNKDNLKTFMQESAKINGETLSEGDLNDFDKFFGESNHNFTLKINKDSHYLNQLNLDMSISDQENNYDVDIAFDLQMSNINASQSISAPVDAQDFNPMSLMGMGALLEGSQGINLNEGMGENFEAMDFDDMEIPDMETVEQMDGMDSADMLNMMEGMDIPEVNNMMDDMEIPEMLDMTNELE